LIDPSRLPLTTDLPSRVKATAFTPHVCPERVAVTLPVFASRSLTLLSNSPVASVLPSGDQATERMPRASFTWAWGLPAVMSQDEFAAPVVGAAAGDGHRLLVGREGQGQICPVLLWRP
jgi:hypothetical protein